MQKVFMACYSSVAYKMIQETTKDTGNYIYIYLLNCMTETKRTNLRITGLLIYKGWVRNGVERSREYKQDSRDEKGATLF